MKKFFGFVIVLIFLVSFPTLSNAQTDERATLTVVGQGEVSGEPNIASFSISVITEGETASSALSDNSAQTQKVIDTLLMSGLSEKDIETSNVSVNPIYDSDVRKILGYEAINSLRARVRNVNRLGEIIDAVVLAGNFTVGGISFSLDDSSKLQEEALRKAVSDAKRKAEVVASAANKSISGIKNINVGSNGFIGFRSFEAPVASSVPILPGDVTVSESVTIKYFLD